MAITSAELQTELGTSENSPRVMQSFGPNDGTYQDWQISGGTTAPGKVKFVRTTAADNAATQAAAVLVSLRVNGS